MDLDLDMDLELDLGLDLKLHLDLDGKALVIAERDLESRKLPEYSWEGLKFKIQILKT